MRLKAKRLRERSVVAYQLIKWGLVVAVIAGSGRFDRYMRLPASGRHLEHENPRCRQRGFCLDQPFNAACTNGGVTSTPVCSAAV